MHPSQSALLGARFTGFVLLALATVSGFHLSFTPQLSIQTAQASGSRVFRILASDLGEYLLGRTPQGRRISELLLGRPIPGHVDLRELRSRLAWTDAETERVLWELESRLTKVEREFGRHRPNRSGEGRPPTIAENEFGLLDDLAAHFLVPENRLYAQGRLQFTRAAGRPFRPRGFRARAVEFRNARPRAGAHLERALPVEAGSIEASLPAEKKIYQRVVDLEYRYFEEESLVDIARLAEKLKASGRLSRVTLKDLVDHAIVLRNDLARELASLSEEYRTIHEPLSNQIMKMSRAIRFEGASLVRYERKAARYASTEFVRSEHVYEVNGYVAIVSGMFGELRVALRVGGLQGHGIMVPEIQRYFPAGPLRSGAVQALERVINTDTQFFTKELDLVMGDGRIWGEVKYYKEAFGRRSSGWKSVSDQARKALEIKRRLDAIPEISRAMGGPIELRIYFVNGIHPAAAEKLERMGIRVYGKIPERALR